MNALMNQMPQMEIMRAFSQSWKFRWAGRNGKFPGESG